MRTRLILLTGFVAALAALRADMIVLKDGREYEGALVEATEAEVVFRRGEEVTRHPRAEVVHVRLQRQREWAEFSRAADIADDRLQQGLAAKLDARQYRGAGTATLYEGTTIELRTPQTWERRQRRIVRILNEHGEDASVDQVYYRPDCETVRVLHAVAVRPDGTVLHLRDTALQDESVYSRYPRYDTVRRLRFATPEGKPGNLLDASVEHIRAEPLEGQAFHEEILLGGSDPVFECEVAVWVPAGIALRWQVLNDAGGTVAFERTAEGDGAWYRWSRRDAPLLPPEPLMPPWADVVPRLVLAAGPATWEAAGEACAESLAAADARLADLPPLPAEDADGLWEFVSRNVQSADVSLLASGPAPQDPMETWRLRSGSPVDRTYLFYRWLALLGEEVHWAWIRPRTQGALAEQAPTAEALPVPAVRVGGVDGRFYVLGSDIETPEETRAWLSGAPVLVAGGGLSVIPAADAGSLGTDRKVALRLDRDGNAEVEDHIVFRGAEARALREWRRLTGVEIQRRVEELATAVNGRAQRVRYEIEGDVRENAPRLALRLRYRVPRLADSRPSVASLQLPWLEYDAWAVGRDERRFPLFWGQPRRDTVAVLVRSPRGFRLEAGPAPRTFAADGLNLAFACEDQAGHTRVSLTYERSALGGDAVAYRDLKACLELRAAIGRDYWVWRKE
ncbi:MAG: hypothetical protein BWZ02_00131 [Lentisphaerae bacterium ADurb.BinA184]|nr:MAG: hypothetical protein BWZ02_00131 [Lentisphaerae bacterium ADurb.BinA184]